MPSLWRKEITWLVKKRHPNLSIETKENRLAVRGEKQTNDEGALPGHRRADKKSEAALRNARELPRWQWTWVFHVIPRVIRDAIYDLVAHNRYRRFGRRDACILPNSDRSWPS